MLRQNQFFLSKLSGTLGLLLLFLSLSVTVTAQTGDIGGVVIDSAFGEPIPGAVVRIEGMSAHGAVTDMDGRFELLHLTPGTYSLAVNAVSYLPYLQKEVRVNAGNKTNVEISLTQQISVGEVIISASRATGSQKAVIEEIRMASQVVSGISAEQIRMSQDRDAAQVMTRVPGVSIVENRFVMVRGVPERYNQVMINNVIAPSTEVDRRTFSFDLIPSNVLDRMMVYKSGTADNVGDFAGGLVKLYTRNSVTDNFTSVSFSTGFRLGTTGEQFANAPGGSATDYLGFDNSRGLTNSFPSTAAMKGSSRRSTIRMEAGRSLSNSFVPDEITALPNLAASFSAGRRWGLGRGRSASMVTALNYGQTYQRYDRDFHRYFTWEPEDVQAGRPIQEWFRYTDRTFEKENRVGVISNWQLKLDAFNRIDFRNLLNQIGENTTIIREGEEFQQYAGLPRRNYMMSYRGRTIYNGQLEGTHEARSSKSSANWILGFNYLGESEPDLRRVRTFKAAQENVYQLILPPSSNLFDAGRYYGKLDEIGLHHALNFEKRFGDIDGKPYRVMVGYLTDYRQRNFTARYFSYLYPGQNDPSVGEEIKRMPLNEVFLPQHIKAENGLTIEEGTRSIDQYEASNLLTSGYIHGQLPFGRLNVNIGLRVEFNHQQLYSKTDAGTPLEVNNPVWSPLAFVNADYAINKKLQARLGYGRTINRPEFRELAPFMFYDFKLDASKVGNPELKTAHIDNLDFRVEAYPREGEVVSIGTFYKSFSNPIETQLFVMTEQPGLGYVNAAGAFSYGLELELRKSFRDVTQSHLIDRFSVNLNGSLIHSEVHYRQGDASAQESRRPLQGQSPYIVNAGLHYDDARSGTQISAAYNIFGSRIYAVGSYLFPTIYELPRHSLDLTIAKKMTSRLAMKLGIQDVLNTRYRFYQDSDGNGNVNVKTDHPIYSYKRGSLYTFTLTYNF